jgi:hypothetical protein
VLLPLAAAIAGPAVVVAAIAAVCASIVAFTVVSAGAPTQVE